jgi:F-type H+-transporting ATPase subunit epsilon
VPQGKLDLRVVSPTETLFEGEVNALVLPAWDGKVGIWPGHAPYIALLGAGMLEADLGSEGRERFFVRRGVARVDRDRVTVLSEYAAMVAPDDFSSAEAWLSDEELGTESASG